MVLCMLFHRSKYLLSTYCLPGSVLDRTWLQNKTDEYPYALGTHSIASGVGREGRNSTHSNLVNYVSVSGSFCCITNCPQFRWLQTVTISLALDSADQLGGLSGSSRLSWGHSQVWEAVGWLAAESLVIRGHRSKPGLPGSHVFHIPLTGWPKHVPMARQTCKGEQPHPARGKMATHTCISTLCLHHSY